MSPFLRLFPLIAMVLIVVSCSESSTTPDDDDHEFVTTIRLAVTDSVTNEIVSYTWEDLDGPGGMGPNRIDTIRLLPGRSYTAAISVLNNSISPADDFTQTIIDEATEHQFFYTTDLDDLVIVYLDKDANNKPLGQSVKLTSGQGANGVLGIVLSHFDEPADKNGIDPSDETDISVILPVKIQ